MIIIEDQHLQTFFHTLVSQDQFYPVNITIIHPPTVSVAILLRNYRQKGKTRVKGVLQNHQNR